MCGKTRAAGVPTPFFFSRRAIADRAALPPSQVIIHMQVVDIRTRYTFKNEGKQPVDSVIVCTEPELAHHLAFFEVIA